MNEIDTPEGSGARVRMSKSIKELGFIGTIVLQEHTDPPRYTIVDGRRRFLALRDLGHASVPAVIIPVGADEATVAAIVLAMNTQRSENPLDEALAVKRLVEEGVDEKEIASRLGVPAATIKKRLRLLTLPPTLLRGVGDGDIAVSVAETLANLDAEVHKKAVALYKKYDTIRDADVSALRRQDASPPPIVTARVVTTEMAETEFRYQVGAARNLLTTKRMHEIVDELADPSSPDG